MRSNRKDRKGAMAVEFALVAPIFFLLIFGGIEFSRIHMIQCAIENAAFEGARRGIVPGATSSECKSVTEDLLEDARIKDFTVTVEPATINAATDVISINVEVPISNENGFGVISFMRDRSLSREINLPREMSQFSEAQ